MTKKINLSLLLVTAMLQTLPAQSPLFNAVYWGTYLQDNQHYPAFNYANTDLIDQVVVDDKNPESIYVVGQSFAPPKTNIDACAGTKTIKLGSGDGYLAKFNRCGEIQWSTFIGDYVQCLALDIQSGKTIIYVAGNITVQGMNGPSALKCDGSSSPIFQPLNDDNTDAFIAKFQDDDSVATLLRWTYYGGTNVNSISGAEDILGLAIYNHTLFAVGNTNSTDLGNGALHKSDSTYGSGSGDGFIAQFDSMLSTLKFFTYVGASGNDRFHDVNIYAPANGNMAVYASGTTGSSGQIASGTGFDQSYNGNEDAFLQKWEDTDGDGLFTKTWGTYIGGTGGEHGRFMQTDKTGNVYLTGFTQSTDMPVTSFAYDLVFGADGSPSTSADAYVIKINSSGGNVWCTYLGGKKDDTANGLTLFKKSGTSYVAISGLTKAASNFFPLVNPLQDKLNGNNNNQYYDAFVAVLTDVSSSQQQLAQCTYMGGSNAEGVQTGVSYHPSIAMGPNKEMYLVTASMSSDINTVVGSEFKHLIQPYIGGSDAFIAKLVDSTNSSQTGCTFLQRTGATTAFDDNGLLLYPNPAQDIAVVELFSSVNEESVTLQLVNSLNQVVTTQHLNMPEGRNIVSLNLSGLPDGIYFLLIRQKEKTLVQKLVKD